MPALSKGDARALLPQYDLPDEQLDVILRIVGGWLLEDTGLESLPDELDGPLWAAATELVILLASNPESLMQRTAGPTSRMWPMAARRDAIRERLRGRYRAMRLAPQGSYPPPTPYPEPAYGGYLPPVQHPYGWAW